MSYLLLIILILGWATQGYTNPTSHTPRVDVDADGNFTVGGSITTGSSETPSIDFDDSNDAGAIEGSWNVNCPTLNDCDMVGAVNSGADTETEWIAARTADSGLTTVEITSGAGVVMNTTSTECIYLDAGAVLCHNNVETQGAGCAKTEEDGTYFPYWTADFDSTTDECGTWNFGLAGNFTGTTAAVRVGWLSNDAACDGGATRDVCWTIDGDSAGSGGQLDTLNPSGTLVGSTSNCAVAGQLIWSPIMTFTHSMGGSANGIVTVCRDPDETIADCATGTDDFAADARIRLVEFCYETSNLCSGE